ncbi:MAG: hypothetical protein Q7R34_01485 [Dehalococcoidia bacterium]|nr:hypothetical protein [Dehalococcoidia bacterium]
MAQFIIRQLSKHRLRDSHNNVKTGGGRVSLREVLHQVDPELKIISGHRRKHKPKPEPVPLIVESTVGDARVNSSATAPSLTMEDWVAAAGEPCPRCGMEAIRFRPEDKVCLNCAVKLNEKIDRDQRKRDRFLKFMKAHNAKIAKKAHH